MSDKTIKVLVVEPMKPCEVREISDDLKSLQDIVGGKIEMVTPFTEPAAIICNAEGKNLDMPPNRLLCDCHGVPYDILCGTFLIAGVDSEHFISLTDSQIHCCKELLDQLMIFPSGRTPSREKPTRQKGKNACNER